MQGGEIVHLIGSREGQGHVRWYTNMAKENGDGMLRWLSRFCKKYSHSNHNCCICRNLNKNSQPTYI